MFQTLFCIYSADHLKHFSETQSKSRKKSKEENYFAQQFGVQGLILF